MKRYNKILSVVVSMALFGNFFSMPEQSQVAAKTLKVNRPCSMCVSDGKIYFTVRTKGIYSYDISKETVKRVVSTEVKDKKYHYDTTIGFSWLSAKGDYLYADWNQMPNAEENDEYVYRISKDGKQVKELAKGYGTVLSGNRLYYTRLAEDADTGHDREDGYGSMKLDGTDKKKIKKPKFSISENSPAEGSSEEDEEQKAISGNYCYYMENDQLKCKNLTDDSISPLLELDSGEKIWDFYVHKKHAIVVVQEASADEDDDYVRLAYYYVRCNGKHFKELKHFAIDEGWF